MCKLKISYIRTVFIQGQLLEPLEFTNTIEDMYLAYAEPYKCLCCMCDYYFTSVYSDIKRVLLEKY